MAWLRSVLFNLCFYILTLVMALTALPVSGLLGQNSLHRFYGIWGRSVVWLARYVLGAKIEIRGREHQPENGVPALIASKHQSELDVMLLAALFPDYGAIAMRELDKYPLVGGIVKKLGHIKVTVSGPRDNQLPEVLEGSRAVHEAGRPILIFPEATLMAVGSKERYRGGVWHIYDDLKIPATPVALNLGLIWPQRKWRKFPATAALEFLPPIEPGLPKKEFLARLEGTIETATNALIREHASPELLKTIGFDKPQEGPRSD